VTKKAAKFEKPEGGYSEVEDLQPLKDAALDELSEIRKVPRDEITDEQLDRAEELKTEITAIKAEETARAEAEAEREARLDAALEEDADEGDADEADEDADDEGDAEEDADEGDEGGDDAEAAKDKKAEPILASARKRPTATARSKSRSARSRKAAEEDEAPAGRSLTITAGADVKGFAIGQDLGTMD
jgi:hypothetical protein